MRIVVNSSPLIALERIGRLDILKALYGPSGAWIPRIPGVDQQASWLAIWRNQDKDGGWTPPRTSPWDRRPRLSPSLVNDAARLAHTANGRGRPCHEGSRLEERLGRRSFEPVLSKGGAKLMTCSLRAQQMWVRRSFFGESYSPPGQARWGLGYLLLDLSP